MNKAVGYFLFLPALALLAACRPAAPGNDGGAVPDAQGDLVGARVGGAFTLVDQDGRTVSWSDFEGKYRLVYFGYTYCPDVCPLDLRDIMAGYRMVERAEPATAAKIQPIFITVDPQRDTPEVVKPYVAAFHRDLVGLTGTPEQIEEVKKAFVVVAGKEGDQNATQDYLVNHSRTPFLFGPDGKPIALVPVGALDAREEDSARAVRDFLVRFVR